MRSKREQHKTNRYDPLNDISPSTLRKDNAAQYPVFRYKRVTLFHTTQSLSRLTHPQSRTTWQRVSNSLSNSHEVWIDNNKISKISQLTPERRSFPGWAIICTTCLAILANCFLWRTHQIFRSSCVHCISSLRCTFVFFVTCKLLVASSKLASWSGSIFRKFFFHSAPLIDSHRVYLCLYLGKFAVRYCEASYD